MARRLVLQGFLSLSRRRFTSHFKTTSGLLAPCTHARSALGSQAVVGGPSLARHISTSPMCNVIFHVQSKDDFQERVIGSDVPVVVDFHANWCQPCKILGPRLEKAVANLQGKVLMAKVDIDEHTDLAIEYEVSAVPTVIALKNGSVLAQFVGLKDDDQVKVFLHQLIGPC